MIFLRDFGMEVQVKVIDLFHAHKALVFQQTTSSGASGM